MLKKVVHYVLNVEESSPPSLRVGRAFRNLTKHKVGKDASACVCVSLCVCLSLWKATDLDVLGRKLENLYLSLFGGGREVATEAGS